MTCKCGSQRKADIYVKHNDLAGFTIERPGQSGLTKEGYLPYIGIFGGDDTQFTVCLDCGQIADWKPITDADLRDSVNEDPRWQVEEVEEEREIIPPANGITEEEAMKIVRARS